MNDEALKKRVLELKEMLKGGARADPVVRQEQVEEKKEEKKNPFGTSKDKKTVQCRVCYAYNEVPVDAEIFKCEVCGMEQPVT